MMLALPTPTSSSPLVLERREEFFARGGGTFGHRVENRHASTKK